MSREIRVFITHSNSDRCYDDGSLKKFHEFAKKLLEEDLRLESIVRENTQSSGPLRESILKMISECDYHIILLTPGSLARPWVIFEFGAGLAGLGSELKGFPQSLRRERVITITEEGFDRARKPEAALYEDLVHKYWTATSRPKKKRVDNTQIAIWPSTFYADKEIKNSLRQLLFQDTFKGRNGSALGHKDGKPKGSFVWDDYETWLETFNSWTCSKMLAMSRQPLKYWLEDGGEYRDILKQNIKKGLRVARLSFWSKDSDILLDDWSDNREAVWQAVGRSGASQYGCQLCLTYDLLWLFLRQCHKLEDEAFYAFPEAIRRYSRLEKITEILIYEEEFVLTSNFSNPGQGNVTYSLDFGGNRKVANSLKGFVKRIQDNALDKRTHTIRIGRRRWTFPAWGKIRSLITELESFHKTTRCNRRLRRPTILD